MIAPLSTVMISKIANTSWLESLRIKYPANASKIINQIKRLKGSDICLRKTIAQWVYFTYLIVFYPSCNLFTAYYSDKPFFISVFSSYYISCIDIVWYLKSFKVFTNLSMSNLLSFGIFFPSFLMLYYISLCFLRVFSFNWCILFIYVLILS